MNMHVRARAGIPRTGSARAAGRSAPAQGGVGDGAGEGMSGRKEARGGAMDAMLLVVAVVVVAGES